MLAVDPEISRIVVLRAIRNNLLRLKWHAAAVRFELALVRHERALKANFDPNQPRVPRGNPDGGQWTSGGGGGRPKNDDRSKTPNEGPSRSSDRTAMLKAVARRIVQTGEAVAAVAKLNSWILTYSATIETYNDPPRSLEDLQRAVSTSAPGYDIHHIVEQNQNGVFAGDDVNGPDNLVRIPRMKHWEINAWYQTENPEFGGQTPRQYLNGRSWDVQRAVGLQALRIHGVLAP